MKKKLSSNQSFGLLFGIIILFISFYIYGFNFTYLILASIIFFIAVIFYEKIFKYPTIFWIKFGIFLGKIINPLVCVFLYYIVIGGTKLLLFILRKKIINKSKQEKIYSYWLIKNNKTKYNFNNQF